MCKFFYPDNRCAKISLSLPRNGKKIEAVQFFSFNRKNLRYSSCPITHECKIRRSLKFLSRLKMPEYEAAQSKSLKKQDHCSSGRKKYPWRNNLLFVASFKLIIVVYCKLVLCQYFPSHSRERIWIETFAIIVLTLLRRYGHRL